MSKLLKMAQKPHRNGKGKAMLDKIRSDLNAIMERDPAAQGVFAAIFLYPSFHVLLFHRIAHPLWRWHFKFIARAIMLFARWLTGIEIHPQAKIGAGLFIDHGMGVVIGQTATIGENVTLYHGVTLGGVNPAENTNSQRDVKRHPTVGDNVIIGAGAQILGPITIHKCARVGGNSVVTKDVGEGITPRNWTSQVTSVKPNADQYLARTSSTVTPGSTLIEAIDVSAGSKLRYF